MKSSCSARGLSVSQNEPEIALILSVSLLSDTHFCSFLLFCSSLSTHPNTHFSHHFTLLIHIQLSSLCPFPPCSLQILSLHLSISSPAVCHQHKSAQLIYNHHYFCQHLVFTMSQFLIFYSVILAMCFSQFLIFLLFPVGGAIRKFRDRFCCAQQSAAL